MASSKPATSAGGQPVSTQPPINNPTYKILSRAHSSSKATAIFTDKLKNKPLLLQPSHLTGGSGTNSNGADKRALRRHIRLRKKQYHLQHQKPRPLSAKEKRQLGLFTLSPSEIKYDLYRRLHRLWHGYMLEILGFTDSTTGKLLRANSDKRITSASHGSIIAGADFHGMQVEVVQCVDVGRVGLKGIVVRETRSTLVLVTTRDKVVTIQKKGALFRVVVPLVDDLDEYQGLEKQNENENENENESHDELRNESEVQVADQSPRTSKIRGGGSCQISKRELVFDLHGSQLEMRPVERAVRKFKWKSTGHV